LGVMGGAAGGGTALTGGKGSHGRAEGAGGAVLPFCDRVRSEAWIGESLLSIAEEVWRVTTTDWIVAS